MITYADIQAAQQRIAKHIVKTPMIVSSRLNNDTNRSIFLKTENFQVGGSFKIRGALSRLALLSESEKQFGVVAWSSGNHAQGVAVAANVVGTKATIVMPSDAPTIKIDNTRKLGAKIRLYDRQTESREEISHDIADKTGAILVPSFDDPHIMAGQGTCGLEISEQLDSLGATIDCLCLPCGGGGLAAGVSTAIKSTSPKTDIYLAEPQEFDDHARSLETGHREKIEKGASSICDALLAPSPGELTWPINKKNLSGAFVVTDQEVGDAVRYAFDVLKLVVEPGGCVALAALLAGKLDTKYQSIGLVLSGGNVDADLYSKLIQG